MSCGLLAGVYREHLLQAGAVREGLIRVEDLAAADEVRLLNSVREWMPAELV